MRTPSSRRLRSLVTGLAAGTALVLAAATAHAFDTDGDGIQDAVDNCPFVSNPGQQDTGGVGAGSLPDGIGDACQCGDVNGDGKVTLIDSVIITRSLLVPPTATLANPTRCDANGDGKCNLADATIVRRAQLLPPTASVSQACVAATAPVPNLIVTQPTYGIFIAPGPGNQCNVNFVGSVPNVENSDLEVTVGGDVVPTTNSAFNAVHVLSGPLESTFVEATRISTGGTKGVNEVQSCADSITASAAAPSGIGVRLNDRGIDRLEPVLNSTIAAQLGDVGALVKSVSPIQVNQCVVDASVGCVITLSTVSISNAGLGAFGIGLDSQTNQVAVSATANNLFADYDAELTGPNCSGRVSATSVNLSGAFSLEPLASNRHQVDVNLVSGPTIGLTGFSNTFTGGVCDFPILSDIINAFAQPKIQSAVVDAVTNALKDPDGGGPADSPLADAAESALGGLDLSGTIGATLGINFDAPFQSIVEDNTGITFRIDANVNPGSLDPLSPQPSSSLKIASTFPTYGANTPITGVPYGVALSIDPTTINKLLRSEVQAGTFKLDVTQLDFSLVPASVCPTCAGLGTQTMTTTNLGAVLPFFRSVSPAENVVVQVRPTLAPAMLDPTAITGVTEVVRAAGASVDFVGATSGKHFIQLAVDGNVQILVNVASNKVDISIVNVANLNARLLDSSLSVNQIAVDVIMSLIAPLGNLQLSQSLESIPLPTILGISIVPRLIDNDPAGNYLSVYLDLN